MSKTKRNNGLWKVTIGSDWDYTFAFDDADEAMRFASAASEHCTPIFSGSLRYTKSEPESPKVSIEYVSAQDEAKAVADYQDKLIEIAEEQAKAREEANS